MSYVYLRRDTLQLRAIAQHYLNRFPLRRYGTCAVDIEGIQEDLGFDIVYRKDLGLDDLKGYVAHEAKYIVVSDFATGKRIRYTIAHELSHKILEFELWTNGRIPDGAYSHELTEQQHKDIEDNAWELARELMEPLPSFEQRFSLHRKKAEAAGVQGKAVVYTAARDTAEDFDVIIEASSRRAKTLGIITPAEYSAAFAVIL